MTGSPSIRVVTAWDSAWDELGSLTAANKRAYCQRWGYGFALNGFRSWYMPPHPAWEKVSLVSHFMRVLPVDWFFWSDADSIIVNPNIPLTTWTDTEANFLIADDGGGINTGNFLIRNCDEMRRVLENVVCWAFENPGEAAKSPWEQRAFQALAFAGKIPGLVKVPQRWFNAYDPALYPPERGGCYEPGDFMLHYPGGSYEWKLERVKERLGQCSVS